MTNHNRAQRRHEAPSADAAKDYFKVRTVEKGGLVASSEDAAGHVYLIRSGRVRIVRKQGEAEVTISILGPGDIFGNVMDQRPDVRRGEAALASEDADIWSIDNKSFQTLVGTVPGVAIETVTSLATRVRALHDRVVGLIVKDVPARVAETILLAAEMRGERCIHGGVFDVKGISQQDIADLIGASRSFVSTQINDMKRQGILGGFGRIICVNDIRALRKAAQSEP